MANVYGEMAKAVAKDIDNLMFDKYINSPPPKIEEDAEKARGVWKAEKIKPKLDILLKDFDKSKLPQFFKPANNINVTYNLKTGDTEVKESKPIEVKQEFYTPKATNPAKAPEKKDMNEKKNMKDLLGKDLANALWGMFEKQVLSEHNSKYRPEDAQYVIPGATIPQGRKGFYRFLFHDPQKMYQQRNMISKVTWIEAMDMQHAISLAKDMWANMCIKGTGHKFQLDVFREQLDEAIDIDIACREKMLSLGSNHFLIYTRNCGDDPMLVRYKVTYQN